MTSSTDETHIDSNEWGEIAASVVSMRTTNPIRRVIDQIISTSNPQKELINLTLGDPTAYGNIKTSEVVVNAVMKALTSYQYNGYAHSTGHHIAKAAIAAKYTTPSAPLTAEDVVICSGCSGALEMSIGVLANEGDNLLLPLPGFSLYQTLCDSKGIHCKYYRLIPKQQWQIDIDHLRSLIDCRTRGIVLNNPSNPCGSVYSKEHLLEVLKVAEEFHLPIISDEIYGSMVFPGAQFYPLATLTSTVPILTVGGLAKEYIVPGWRVGWILIHDRHNRLKQVREGIGRLSTLLLGANTVVQGALPEILRDTPQSHREMLVQILYNNSSFLVDRISQIRGLIPIRPHGAMYMMIGIDQSKFPEFVDDIAFAKALLAEEAVFVLPGQVFRIKNFMRLVVCPPLDKLREACDRLENFCNKHYQSQ
jgi:tyrosine aminotransferase